MSIKVRYILLSFFATLMLCLWLIRDLPTMQLGTPPPLRSDARRLAALEPEYRLPPSEPTTRPSPDDAKLTDTPIPFTWIGFEREVSYRVVSNDAERQRFGRCASRYNVPIPISSPPALATGQWYLLVEPQVSASSEGSPQNMRLVLVNATKKPLAFETMDAALSIQHQAMDSNGNWRTIGSKRPPPSPWSPTCGAGFYRMPLPAGHFWSFAVPQYAGPEKTKMRMALTAGGRVTYSNEFDGWIVPSMIEFPDSSDVQPSEKPEREWQPVAKRFGMDNETNAVPTFGSEVGQPPLRPISPATRPLFPAH